MNLGVLRNSVGKEKSDNKRSKSAFNWLSKLKNALKSNAIQVLRKTTNIFENVSPILLDSIKREWDLLT